METVEQEYRGYILSYLKIPLNGAQFTVNVASNDPRLYGRLRNDQKIIVDGASIERVVEKAKRVVDEVLGG